MYLGDYAEDATLYFCWTSNDKDGASITRATNGTIQIYKDDSTTELTAGITDTEDFNSLAGIHNCKIDLSADAFYAAGHDYSVVLNGAIIDGETVNAVLAHFSIENRFTSQAFFEKAAKAIINKAVQNKSTGAIVHYDDDGSTPLVTLTPTESSTEITRTPS